MIRRAVGTVLSTEAPRPGVTTCRVAVAGRVDPAWSYDALTGPLRPGDRVLLNTTAVHLGLGTGGWHFVMAVLDGGSGRGFPRGFGAGPPEFDALPGHLLKLRYTPSQLRVFAVEEEGHPGRAALAGAGPPGPGAPGLEGRPVVVCTLHSQLAPAAGGLRAGLGAAARIGYVMTDDACLPLAFSDLVAACRAAGLVDVTVTAGQAFGGDLEAISLPSALLAAARVARADAVVVAPGPGGAGTGTRYGFGGVEQAWTIDVTNRLGGRAVVAPRLSDADPRPRHGGLSHHTLTVLDLAYSGALVALPAGRPAAAAARRALAAQGLDRRHAAVVVDGGPGLAECARRGVPLESMGRGPADDPAFFEAAAAAGLAAAGLVGAGAAQAIGRNAPSTSPAPRRC